ncbi:MAG TPA: hypothetical protein VNL18_09215 [Gemmatimonadales bacterium]|nr:hypothetical protein [Gemmatimonadales bacterium]
MRSNTILPRYRRGATAVALVTVLFPVTAAAQQRRAAASTPVQAIGDSARDPLAAAVAGLRFRSIGPALLSGRISDLAVHPHDKKIWYVATASGGLWKTTNAGTTFTPIFDDQPSYSIGVVVIDPRNPNVVWVGTGENNAQRSVSFGDGIYKSIDGGRTWQNMGLKESEHIGKIVIDPRNSNVLYVAAQGPVFKGGGDRGLYKTTDGGKTWSKILDGGEWGGVTDVVLDPRNPDVLLAATWQRTRRQWGYIAGGPESGLHRSMDGGATWTKSQRGFPSEELGRIGLAISPANPDVVYAIVEAANQRGGFYRSRDNGVNWERMSAFTTIGLYYQEIFADPKDVDRVYAMDVRTMITEDGGRTFRPLGERNKHVDNHVVWIDPDDTDHLLIGCDGGLYESWDRGQNYVYFPNLPLGQFYRVEVDNSMPFYRVYGGTQDNNSIGGPARTRTVHGILNQDWFFTQGGDGFQTRVDPKDPNIVYSEYQHGGLSRFNLATGEEIDIVPQPEPGEAGLRWHWDAPLLISPHSNTRLYFAANRVFRSDNQGNTWRAVSPDLTRQIDRNRLRMMGRVWSVDAVAKNTSTSLYGSIVTMAESPLKEGLLWIGTDDGLIQVSEDGGANWRRIERVPGVPDTAFVSRVAPSQHDVNTVYASFDNHKAGDYRPYVVKSTDLGRTWTSISGNLPERGTVYVVIEDHKDRNLLFAGTEFGLYFTNDGGKGWTRLRGGLPTIQVRDLAIQKRDDDLVVATFGRSFYVLDNLEPLRSLSPAVLASDAALLPVKRVPLYVQSSPLGGTGVGWQGARFYAAQNPPFGAVFTYYLKEEIRTRRARRQAAEREVARAGQDVFYPPWDSLKAEDREEAPGIVLTVTDEEGRVVRRLSGPVTAGTHRVSWDLRYPPPNPPRPVAADSADDGGFGGQPRGPYVVPGTYLVSLAKRVDGVVTPLGEPRSFEVYPLDGGAPRTPAVLAFQQRTWQLQRAVLGANALATETMNRLQLLKRAVEDTPGLDGSLANEVRQLESRLRDIQESLNGDPTVARRQESTPPSLAERLSRAAGGAWSGTLGDVTDTHKRQYDIVAAEFRGLLERLRALIEGDLKRVEDAAEAAGVPWTTGRLPRWPEP